MYKLFKVLQECRTTQLDATRMHSGPQSLKDKTGRCTIPALVFSYVAGTCAPFQTENICPMQLDLCRLSTNLIPLGDVDLTLCIVLANARFQLSVRRVTNKVRMCENRENIRCKSLRIRSASINSMQAQPRRKLMDLIFWHCEISNIVIGPHLSSGSL